MYWVLPEFRHYTKKIKYTLFNKFQINSLTNSFEMLIVKVIVSNNIFRFGVIYVPTGSILEYYSDMINRFQVSISGFINDSTSKLCLLGNSKYLYINGQWLIIILLHMDFIKITTSEMLWLSIVKLVWTLHTKAFFSEH